MVPPLDIDVWSAHLPVAAPAVHLALRKVTQILKVVLSFDLTQGTVGLLLPAFRLRRDRGSTKIGSVR